MSSSGNPPGPPAKSTRALVLVVAAVVVLAAAGITAWRVIADRSSGSGPEITGEAVEQVLLDGTELAEMLGQPFKSTTPAPIYGGLREMAEPSTVGDCVGVMNVAAQRVYQSADVQSYARQTWADATPDADRSGAQVMFVEESVVALPNAAAARALFAKFADQWKRCDGLAVDAPHLPGTEIHITDVRVFDTVLAASIALDRKPNAPDARAVGVQGNCLVGVLIAFTGAADATGPANPATSSIDMVRAMMDKVAEHG